MRSIPNTGLFQASLESADKVMMSCQFFLDEMEGNAPCIKVLKGHLDGSGSAFNLIGVTMGNLTEETVHFEELDPKAC